MFDSFKNMKESTEGAGIELFGNRRAIVFDCQCVVDYSEDFIVLNLGKLNLKIRGEGLVLSSFSLQTEQVRFSFPIHFMHACKFLP